MTSTTTKTARREEALNRPVRPFGSAVERPRVGRRLHQPASNGHVNKELRMKTQEMMRAIAPHRYGSADNLGMTNADMSVVSQIERLATFMQASDASPAVCVLYRFYGGSVGMADLKQARSSSKPVIVEGT